MGEAKQVIEAKSLLAGVRKTKLPHLQDCSYEPNDLRLAGKLTFTID